MPRHVWALVWLFYLFAHICSPGKECVMTQRQCEGGARSAPPLEKLAYPWAARLTSLGLSFHSYKLGKIDGRPK